MNFIRAAAILIFVSAALCTEVLGKSWRGIEPLRSTRADVLRILGKPTNSLRYSDYFKLREYLDSCPPKQSRKKA